MTKKLTTTILLALALLSFITAAHAEAVSPEVVTVDGREILLKADGTWVYRSTDRFTDTSDGRRVRLKDDGSWQYAGNAPLTSKEQVRTTDHALKLEKVVIETFKKKTQKSSRVKTQTVFYVQLNYSAQAKNSIGVAESDTSLLEVNDNNGKNYKVLSIRTDQSEIKPGTESILQIRAEKSPSIWDDVKSMQVVFKPGILGIEKAITLSQRKTDFLEQDVDGFD